jgi:hypothetical protein
MRSSAPLVLGLALAVGAASCDKSTPVAQSDWTVVMFATPAELTLGSGQEGQAVITAALYDRSGIPQPDVNVLFAASAGRLDSGGAPVRTNGQGQASDVLHTTQTATVTAVSGALTKTVTVTVVAHTPNAVINITPASGAAAGIDLVTFDGTGSTDPTSGHRIVSYTWTFLSSNADPDWPNPHTETTPVVEKTFENAQTLTVTLTVADNLGAIGSKTVNYVISAR